MDKAYWGSMRWGYFRWGVTITLFDDVIEQLEKIHIEESAYWGKFHWTRARWGEKDSSLFKAAVEAASK